MSKAFNVSMIMEDKWCVSAAATDPDCEGEASPKDRSAAEIDLSKELGPCHRIRCAACTLQLAVNGALRKDQAYQDLLGIVSRVVNRFRRSLLRTGRLKEICSEGLVPTAGMRWNSALAALKRLAQVYVFDTGKQLVQEHTETSRTSGAIDTVPPIFAQSRLAELQGPLKPLGDATDRLQGNGITSAILRLTIRTCYVRVKTYPAEEIPLFRSVVLVTLNLYKHAATTSGTSSQPASDVSPLWLWDVHGVYADLDLAADLSLDSETDESTTRTSETLAADSTDSTYKQT
ncbi:hypothetical protein ISCGN_012528 [Ixodes scapularis]